MVRLLIVVFLLASCRPSDSAASLVHAEWSKHEGVLVALRDGSDVSLSDFEMAYLFFTELTDVEIAVDHSTLIDYLPTEESHLALGELRDWYSMNRTRLAWDPAGSKVKLKGD